MKRMIIAAGVMGMTAMLGHRWVSLAWNASSYPVAAPSARTQVVVEGSRAYIAAGVDGIEVAALPALAAPGKSMLVRPQVPADRIDDLAVADGWLFALDATPPGHLMAYSLVDPDRPAASGAPVPVPVGPFSGVSAAHGVVAVSGGTSLLTLREYDGAGRFGSEVATADFGRGQPDVALNPAGTMAAISTHLYGPEFAVTFAKIERHPLRLRGLSQLRLKEAGFTAGGFKPAHFPLVAAWRGDRVYVAEGGGLDVIDVSDPARPRLLAHDPLPQPAIDLVVAGNELYVLRAGSEPAVLRYRLDSSGLPKPSGIWGLPAGTRPAALARSGADLLITLQERGWQRVPATKFSPIHSGQP